MRFVALKRREGRGCHPPPRTDGSQEGSQEDGPVRPPGKDSVVKELHRPLRDGSWSKRFEAFWYTDGAVGALRPVSAPRWGAEDGGDRPQPSPLGWAEEARVVGPEGMRWLQIGWPNQSAGRGRD
jgi:hypothetical protein